MAGAAPAIGGGIVDLNVAKKSYTFDSTQESWPDWRFTVENYFGCVDLRFSTAGRSCSVSRCYQHHGH